MLEDTNSLDGAQFHYNEIAGARPKINIKDAAYMYNIFAGPHFKSELMLWVQDYNASLNLKSTLS